MQPPVSALLPPPAPGRCRERHLTPRRRGRWQRRASMSPCNKTTRPEAVPSSTENRSAYSERSGQSLPNVVLGFLDNLLHHLHIAGGKTTVYGQHGAGDPGSLVRRQEEGGSGHILRLADAAERIPPRDPLEDVGILLHALLPGRRPERTGCYGVHAHTGGPVAHSQAPRQVENPGLGRT